jgi:hypothetical protein
MQAKHLIQIFTACWLFLDISAQLVGPGAMTRRGGGGGGGGRGGGGWGVVGKLLCHLAKKQNKHTNDVCWFPSLKVSGPQASSLLDHPLKK